MRRRGFLTLTSVTLATGTLAGSLRARPAYAAAGTIPVTASFSILADFVHQIGGGAVAISSFVGPDGDAHTFEPRPSDLKALQAARLLVVNGLGLEGWMDRLVQAAGYAGSRVVATQGVQPIMLNAHEIDPHAWQNPRNGVIYARNVAAGLAQAAPEHADAFHAAADDLIVRIQAADADIAARIGDIPASRRKIITTHDAFGYYGARYGIEFRAAQGLSTDAEPSAKAIATLARQIRAEGIKAVFLENMTDPRIARALAHEAGAIVGPPVYSDALSKPGGPADTYLRMLTYNTDQFARAMAGNPS